MSVEREKLLRPDQSLEKLGETAVPRLSDHRVGIGNIFERNLPDENGVVAPRMSAILSIFDPKTKQTRNETVIVGSVVTIGTDRYCIVNIEEGQTEPGWVFVRKLAP